MTISLVLVSVGFTIRLKVASESHPVTRLSSVASCCPSALKVKPFQIKGNSVSQTIESVIVVKVGCTIKFKDTRESHPVTKLVKIAV